MNEQVINAALRAAKAEKHRLDLGDDGRGAETGLRLLITSAGTATWFLRRRDREGAQRRYRLGRWPAMGVADARTAARRTGADVDAGADPISSARAKRKAARDAREGIGTLAALIEAYGKTEKAQRLKRWRECKRRIESVFAKQMKRPLSALARADLQATANTWPAPQSAAAAVRYIRPVLKWATGQGDLPESFEPSRLVPPATVGRRDRVLDRGELAALLPVLRDSDRPYAAALRFMLLTLARRDEVCSAQWGSVDLDALTWTISDTKNGQPHVVPLSKQAVALLKGRRPEKVRHDALVFANRDRGALQNWDRETKAIMEDSKTEGWTRHDLRRTGATMLGEMGELPDIIEAALNHVAIRSQLAATYNRSRYRPQVAAALQRLADALDGIEAGAAKIVQLHPTAV